MSKSLKIKVTETVELHLIQAEHAEELFDVVDRHRDFLREWLPWLDMNKTLHEQKKFIEIMQERGRNGGAPTFIIKEEGKIVGVVGHNTLNQMNRSAGMGYWLIPAAGGKGIMNQACSALLRYSFEELGLERVSCACAVGNDRSRSVIERLGFVCEGTARHAENLYGKFVDHFTYSILKDEWQERSE